MNIFQGIVKQLEVQITDTKEHVCSIVLFEKDYSYSLGLIQGLKNAIDIVKQKEKDFNDDDGE